MASRHAKRASDATLADINSARSAMDKAEKAKEEIVGRFR